MKKNKLTIKNNPIHKVLIGFFLLVVIGFFIYSSQKSKVNPEQPISPLFFNDSLEGKITPTVYQAQREGWNKFIHPNKDFTVEYPETWTLVLTQRGGNPSWYIVNLESTGQQAGFYFTTGGRGLPNFDYKTEQKKQIGPYTMDWTTLYQADKPFQAFANFSNKEFGDKLRGVYISLPEENQEQFIQTVEEIIATLK